MTLEEAIREYYADLRKNIQRDEEIAARMRDTTNNLATAQAKRAHRKVKERVQIEHYKKDALMTLARRGGITLH